MPVTIAVNGRPVETRVEPRTHLADFLRDGLRLSGTHLGCEHGVCGACTVLIDGAPARSCLALAVACDGRDVRTIEGFETDDVMASLRDAFSREHGLQCGFCTPGMLIASRDIVLRLPEADEPRVRHELSGNLCRCTGYAGIVAAVCRVLDERRAAGLRAPEADRAGVAVRVADAPSGAGAPAGPSPRRQNDVPPRPREPVTARAEAEALPAGQPRPGWTRFEESFVVNRPPADVWAALGDFPKVAACLPGAELSENDGRTLKGRLAVKLGPMAAAFAGSAVVERDDAALAGTIKGAGSDSGSGSRTKGEVAYRLEPAEGGATRIVLVADYNLQGPLAQFSRSALAQELGRRLVAEFAANLDRSLGTTPGEALPEPGPARLDAGRLLWAVARDRIRAVLQRVGLVR